MLEICILISNKHFETDRLPVIIKHFIKVINISN